MSGPTVYPAQYGWAARVDRMTKDELAAHVDRHPSFVGSAHPPREWSVGDLVDTLVEMGCPRHARAFTCQECQ